MKKFSFIFLLFIISCNYEEKEKQNNFEKKASLEIKNTLEIKNNGEKIFNESCATCHLYGTVGSIIINDKKKWENIINKRTVDEIYNNVLNGYVGKNGIMPSRGGCINCSDNDLIDAVNYIFSFNSISIDN